MQFTSVERVVKAEERNHWNSSAVSNDVIEKQGLVILSVGSLRFGNKRINDSRIHRELEGTSIGMLCSVILKANAVDGICVIFCCAKSV